MTLMQTFILLCGLAAVIYGLITSRQILSLSPGNEKMIEIAKAIQEGAQAYFTANYQGITSVTLAYPLSVTLVSDNSEVLVEDDYEAIDLITNICGID